ncbi:MAG: DUF2513 domain-containing protein [Cellvibrionaceae bacterium]
MKQDNSYIRELLIAVEEISGIDFDINSIQNLGYDINEEKFIYHFRLIADQQLVTPASNTGYGFGYDGQHNFSWNSVVPFRISARGHEFLSAVTKNEVWEKMKTDFSDASISLVVQSGLKLAEGWAKKKVSALLEDDQ